MNETVDSLTRPFLAFVGDAGSRQTDLIFKNLKGKTF